MIVHSQYVLTSFDSNVNLDQASRVILAKLTSGFRQSDLVQIKESLIGIRQIVGMLFESGRHYQASHYHVEYHKALEKLIKDTPDDLESIFTEICVHGEVTPPLLLQYLECVEYVESNHMAMVNNMLMNGSAIAHANLLPNIVGTYLTGGRALPALRIMDHMIHQDCDPELLYNILVYSPSISLPIYDKDIDHWVAVNEKRLTDIVISGGYKREKERMTDNEISFLYRHHARQFDRFIDSKVIVKIFRNNMREAGLSDHPIMDHIPSVKRLRLEEDLQL